MIYLSNPPAKGREYQYRDAGIGVMWTPNMGNVPSDLWPSWGVDNGCYTRPDLYTDEGYLRRLSGFGAMKRPLFATAPDVVGDAAATLERSLPMLPRIRETGQLAGFVAQNGQEILPVPWDELDVLFLGGSPECLPCGYVRPSDKESRKVSHCPHCGAKLVEWKLDDGAWSLTQEAKRRHKWVHMGRVNSCKRIVLAASWGCDSSDGTFVGFGPDENLPKVIDWLRAVREAA